MSRRPFIAGNWKLNLGPAAASDLATQLRAALSGTEGVDVAVYPTALSIGAVVPVLDGSVVAVGVQQVAPAQAGALTGANSAEMAREAGCTHALVGHSERRQYWGETDDDVNRRVKACLEASLLPTVCIGETLAQRDAGEAETVVLSQLDGALAGVPEDQLGSVTLAYEPVWAIGTGRTATPDQAQAIHAVIRAHLAAHYPVWFGEQVRVLYGGSVKPANASELLSCPDIDGALVGGASLNAASFAAIIAAAS